ncbi:OLC1v1021705C1 [Oldenlandia corymbosa var. corymbosa]|uniref:OLC1v1021705C1 n=1 Tax=Oldenlandia corymbosa var. corymbosa TaxID=529605 RepID=A0AAV1BYV1_OLDCO|nr:OLC1v1021705C1 [Oldenlandia corymbosa var. corymbosa]
MNGKASVSKELNAKHVKILEGLLKLPENRDCADCKSKGPRWASVNLGVFICLQCSGIHRSLGVHISKVRSATLDTWLPDQVEFIKSMGNEKSNSYWEAELPPRYDRVGIENFIRAKYVEKRWIPRDVKGKSSAPVREERIPDAKPVPEIRSAGYAKRSDPPALLNGSNFVVPKLPKPINTTNVQQVASAVKLHEVHQKSQPPDFELKEEKQGEMAIQLESASKVNYATDVSNKLPREETKQNNSGVSNTEKQQKERVYPDKAGLPAAETPPTMDSKVVTPMTENRSKFDSGIEELLRDFQWNTPAIVGKPVEDAKNDITEKPTVEVFHPVQPPPPAKLAEQRHIHTAATQRPSYVSQSPSVSMNQANVNIQNWGRINSPTPRRMVQQTGSTRPLNTPAASTGLTSRYVKYVCDHTIKSSHQRLKKNNKIQ